jgi:fatty acid desaturase
MIVLVVAYVVLTLWLAACAAFPAAALLALVSGPLGLVLYARLHEHHHASGAAPRAQIVGIAYSSLLGMTWIGYRKHHANHHRFNNGAGDYSSTLDAKGRELPGWLYVLKCALVPYMLQLVPFLVVLGMKRAHRTPTAWLDEAARVGLRASTVLLLGPVALGALLAWQLAFFVFLFYLNYLQHFGVPSGQGVVWEQRWLNAPALNIGLHDQHHAQPSLAWDELPGLPPRTRRRTVVGLFDPITFGAFLASPRALARRLSQQELA